MEAVRRCSHLLALACLVSRIVTARVSCGAHQNVDAWGPRVLLTQPPLQMTSPSPIIFPYPNPMSLPPALLPHHVPADPRLLLQPHPHQGLGSGANQPNVITQSVTWAASKKGVTAKPTTTIETDCPTEDFIIDSPEKSMRLIHPSRQRCRAECPECELDNKLRRLVEILDNMQAKESDSGTYCRRTRSSRMRRPKWWRRYEDEEEDDYPTKEDDYTCSEELPERRRRPRRRMQRICDCEEPEEELEPVPARKRVPMVPKMDWLVLKKVPKKSTKRYMREEDDRRRDYSVENGMRDILYIPPCDTKEKYRKRADPEYDR